MTDHDSWWAGLSEDDPPHGLSYWRSVNSVRIEVGHTVEIAAGDPSVVPSLAGLRGKVDGFGVDCVAVDLAALPGYAMVLPSALRVMAP
jgi:hypothetical protein